MCFFIEEAIPWLKVGKTLVEISFVVYKSAPHAQLDFGAPAGLVRAMPLLALGTK